MTRGKKVVAWSVGLLMAGGLVAATVFFLFMGGILKVSYIP